MVGNIVNIGAFRMRHRHGFTLVELLVVMTIIGVLMALLLPAVNMIRESARQTTCMNNLRNVGLGVIQHDTNKGVLPGWVGGTLKTNNGNTIANPKSWVFQIFNYIEMTELAKQYRTNASAADPVNIPILICPDDTESLKNGAAMTYVANSGLRDADPTNGCAGNDADQSSTTIENWTGAVFLNTYGDKPVAQTISQVSSADGSATTLMLSENIDAGTWKDLNEGLVGFCYVDSPQVPNCGTNGATMRINSGRGRSPGLPRASSYHPGGVMVVFCDNHTKFIAEDINWAVWCKLFTPQGAEAFHPYPVNGTANTRINPLFRIALTESF